MKPAPYILAVILAVGAYFIARGVASGPDKQAATAQVATATSQPPTVETAPSTAAENSAAPSVLAPPVKSPFTITAPDPMAGLPPDHYPDATPAPVVPPTPKPHKAAAKPGVKTAAITNPNPLGTRPGSSAPFSDSHVSMPQGNPNGGGADNSTGVVDIGASQILGLMDKAYRGLQALTATVDCRTSDSPDRPTVHGVIAFRRRPERAVAMISAPQTRTVLYDGTNIIVYPAPDKNHYTKTINFFSNLQGSGISAVLGRLVDDPSRDILSRLIASDYNSQHALEPFQRLEKGDATVVNGTLCDRVIATRDADVVTLSIGHADHVLRRIEWSSPDGASKPWWFFEDFSDVGTKSSINAALFAFKPPSGITLYSAR